MTAVPDTSGIWCLLGAAILTISDVWRLAGKGEPEHDERNACAVIGSGSNLKLTKVNLSNVGFYAWENASATLLDCCVDGGLHGLLVWGRGQVQATGCSFLNAQKSGVCVQGGAAVTLKVHPSPIALIGVGILKYNRRGSCEG